MSEQIKALVAPGVSVQARQDPLGGSPREALKRQVAELPYAQQVEALSPTGPLQAPVQQLADPAAADLQFAKGKSFRGGSKKSRDNWYGYDDKGFQRWWHRDGKAANGGDDIEDAQHAKAMFEQWVGLGKPVPK